MSPPTQLPIAPLLPKVLAAARDRAVVVSAPTGSGKSTCVPPTLVALGRVLVVEPRRVACRALATRVAELQGCAAGTDVGWIVRDERRVAKDASITFVTPGVALRIVQSGDIDRYGAIVLDEFHERSFDMDLLLCLLQERRDARAPGMGGSALVVMSATLQGDRLAEHLGGVHLVGKGRTFPITMRWLPGDATLPTKRGLEQRLGAALDACRAETGDVLVFLPGKGEIARAEQSLKASHGNAWEVATLHGGMTLRDQSAVLRPRNGQHQSSGRRRVILATNVAETSLTIPGIGVVIDSGLVRGMVYRAGRGYLSLLPIALDAAAQRAGRAGRMGPGVCIRLWPQGATLSEVTLPEIHRGSLVSLTLAALACSPRGMDLPWLDRPKSSAVAAAMAELTALGCVQDGVITEAGTRLFSLPLDVALARLLAEGAAVAGLAEPTLLLAAALSGGRSLFQSTSRGSGTRDRVRPSAGDDLRAGGCDALALIEAVRAGDPGRHGLDAKALAEARASAKRFRKLGFGDRTWSGDVPRRPLAELLMRLWPGSAHVRRDHKKRRYSWASGGSEMELDTDSGVPASRTKAVVVLDSRAVAILVQRPGSGLLITAAMPVPMAWLETAGLGEDQASKPEFSDGRLSVTVSRVYAGVVLSTRVVAPRGNDARVGVRDLILAGRCFEGSLPSFKERYELACLASQITARPDYLGTTLPMLAPMPEWLLGQLEQLGLESGEDLALIEADDLMPAAPPADVADLISRRFPATLNIGDASYRIVYEVAARKATFHQVRGSRKQAPTAMHLPRLPGFRLFWEHKNRIQPISRR
ncbi:MAG: ATP-dependent helicase HrpB [Myxococcota bacterium]|jgi:ATP-dependent helicase HrpB